MPESPHLPRPELHWLAVVVEGGHPDGEYICNGTLFRMETPAARTHSKITVGAPPLPVPVLSGFDARGGFVATIGAELANGAAWFPCLW